MTQQKQDKVNEIVERVLSQDASLAERFQKFVDVGAERALLSVLLNHPEKFHEIKATFKPHHLQNVVNKRVFEIIMWISDNRCSGGFVTLDQIFYETQFHSELQNKAQYLQTLKQYVYNEDAFKSVKKILLSKAIQRQKFALACETMGQILEYQGENIEEILLMGADENLRLIEKNMCEATMVEKVGDGLRDRLRERAKNPVDVPGIPLTRYPCMSDILGGLKPENLIVGLARPKRGKSTYQLGMAVDLGIYQGIPVGIIESEMNRIEQEDRLVAALSSVEVRKIETGLFVKNKEDGEAIKAALELIENKSKIYMRRITMFDTKTIVNAFRLMKALYDIRVGFFDQIKDTTDNSPHMEKEHQRLGWLAFALKSLAEELKIGIHANMQLSRAGVDNVIAEGNTDPATLMYGSDRVLQLASSGYFIRNKVDAELKRDGNIIQGGNVIVNVFFNRGGDSHPWTGGINYLHRKKYTRFEEIGTVNVS